MASADPTFAPTPTLDSLPLFGGLFRVLAKTQGALALLTIVLALVVWGAAIVTFGLPGLYLPAVVASPLMVAMLVAISRG